MVLGEDEFSRLPEHLQALFIKRPNPGSDEVLACFPETKAPGRFPKNSGGLGKHGIYGSAPGMAQVERSVDDGAGSAARFFQQCEFTEGDRRLFYCAKASRAERGGDWLDKWRIVYVSCSAWESEDQKAQLLVDTEPSAPRVIAVSGAPCNDESVWNTLLFGNDLTGQSRSGSKSTTETRTSSTTTSETWSSFRRWLTNGFTAGASSERANGGSPAESVASGTPSITITSDLTVSVRGVERAPSPTLFEISDGGKQPGHPTVKPVALMRWLVRLVTPPGGTVLDPFAGSGTTGIAAGLEQFRATLIEMDPKYAAIAQERLNAQLGMFARAAE